MENFFQDEIFHSSLEEYLEYNDMEEEDIKALSDDWSDKVEMATSEKIFQLDMDFAVHAIMSHTDKWEDRYPCEPDERFDKRIEDAIKQGIDLEKINAALPELYYPNGIFKTITKQDLIECL